MACGFDGEGGGWGYFGWGEGQWGEGEGTTLFRGPLLDLLPPGPAWTREDGSWMHKLIGGISVEIGRIAQSACNLFDEALPTTANHLLDEHLQNAGIPSLLCPVPETIEGKRAALHAAWTSRATPNKATLIQIAEDLGYTNVTITSPAGQPFRAGYGRAGMPLRSKYWIFHWIMNATRPAHFTDDVMLTCALTRVNHEHITFSLNIS